MAHIVHRDKKTDTASGQLAKKVDLRLHFLRKYHETDARVFDACQGDGEVWAAVRKDFEVTHYWGGDKARKAGRLNIDSVALLAQGVADNVIDVDTYGSPWDHWLSLLPNIKQPTTVFLTWGSMGVSAMPERVKQFIGIGALRMPVSLPGKLWHHAVNSLLSAPLRHGLEIVECRRCRATQNVEYFGLHIIQKKA